MYSIFGLLARSLARLSNTAAESTSIQHGNFASTNTCMSLLITLFERESGTLHYQRRTVSNFPRKNTHKARRQARLQTNRFSACKTHPSAPQTLPEDVYTAVTYLICNIVDLQCRCQGSVALGLELTGFQVHLLHSMASD
jgi:hypothetical protein